MKKYYFILFFCTAAILLRAQVPVADKYYDQKKYAQAAEEYRKYINSSSSINPQIYLRLADCYRLIYDYTQAEMYYSMSLGKIVADPIYVFYHAICLKSIGKLDEAQAKFAEYIKLVPNDKKADLELRSCEELKYISKQTLRYSVSNVSSVNSSTSEYGAVPFQNGIVVVKESVKDLIDFDRTQDNHSLYYNLMYVTVNKSKSVAPVATPETNYTASRDSVMYTYGKVHSFSSRLNNEYHNGSACFSADMKTIYFTRVTVEYVAANSKANYAGIYISELSGNKWTKPKPFKYNNKKCSIAHPTLSVNGNVLYFSSDMPGGYGGKDIYFCTKQNDGWSAPQNIGALINTPGDEMFPFIRSDDVLYFSSNGRTGFGQLDIFQTSMKNGQWADPENLGKEMNSPADDFSIVFTGDNTEGYFSSNRIGGKGSDDIYRFNVKNNLISISGKILLSQKASDVAKGLKVLLLTQDGQVLNVTTTDASGFFIFERLSPETKYMVKIDENDPQFVFSKKYFLTDKNDRIVRVAVINDKGKIFVFENLPADDNSLLAMNEQDVQPLSFAGNIFVGENPSKPLADRIIKLVDENGKVIGYTKTNVFGTFLFTNLSPGDNFYLSLDESQGPLPPNVKITITNKSGKEVTHTYTGKDGFFRFKLLSPENNSMSMLQVEENDLRQNISGRITADDKNIRGLLVKLLRGSELVASTKTDLEGKFLFSNLSGSESYMVAIDENDPQLGSVRVIKLLDGNNTVVKEYRLKAEPMFLFRILPNESSQLTDLYVDDPWLKVLQMKTEDKFAKPEELTIIENVYYEYGQYNILSDAQKVLDKVVEVMKRDPNISIEISSHTDSRSSDQFNMQLSQKRAQTAVEYVVSRGIPQQRITGKGYGETKLKNRCVNGVECGEEEHAQNRRTEFKIVRK